MLTRVGTHIHQLLGQKQFQEIRLIPAVYQTFWLHVATQNVNITALITYQFIL